MGAAHDSGTLSVPVDGFAEVLKRLEKKRSDLSTGEAAWPPIDERASAARPFQG